LLELLTESSANLKEGVHPNLLAQEQILQIKLNNIEQQRVKLLSGKYTEEEKNKLEDERGKLLEEFKQLEDEMRRSSPKYADLKYPQPLTLKEVQKQILDEDTAILQ
jgi:hypothetical protein